MYQEEEEDLSVSPLRQLLDAMQCVGDHGEFDVS